MPSGYERNNNIKLLKASSTKWRRDCNLFTTFKNPSSAVKLEITKINFLIDFRFKSFLQTQRESTAVARSFNWVIQLLRDEIWHGCSSVENGGGDVLKNISTLIS